MIDNLSQEPLVTESDGLDYFGPITDADDPRPPAWYVNLLSGLLLAGVAGLIIWLMIFWPFIEAPPGAVHASGSAGLISSVPNEGDSGQLHLADVARLEDYKTLVITSQLAADVEICFTGGGQRVCHLASTWQRLGVDR